MSKPQGESELTSRLLVTTEEGEALAILRDHPQLITVNLCQRLKSEAERARQAADLTKATLLFQLTREAAVISDKRRLLLDVPL